MTSIALSRIQFRKPKPPHPGKLYTILLLVLILLLIAKTVYFLASDWNVFGAAIYCGCLALNFWTFRNAYERRALGEYPIPSRAMWLLLGFLALMVLIP